MPRIRTIKPDFFISDTVTALPLRARLTWIGLWTHCDDYGRCRDNVKLVKAAVWPLDDVSLRDIASDLDDLEQANLLYRYTVEGKSYIQITNWDEHQKVDRPSKSPIPGPGQGTATRPDWSSNAGNYVEPSTDTRETLASPREPASRARDRKGKEGNGREGTRAPARDAPPPTCPKHLDQPDPPPCGPCGDARRHRAAWERDQATAASEARSQAAHERAAATRAATAACTDCGPDGYLPSGRPCHHDPRSAERTHTRIAEVRANIRPPRPGAAA